MPPLKGGKAMKDLKPEEIRQEVKKHYGQTAKNNQPCCCGPSTEQQDADAYSKSIGYSDEDLKSVPEGSNLGLGCGNPVAIASLKPGEVVVDLGSGAGFDAFLARREVGESGQVIGVDMTDEMLKKARANAEKAGYTNVEFRKGEIEKLPIDDDTADCVISNCVINLSPDKPQVFAETYRVLKPGGRLMVSDIVLTGELPDETRKSVEAYVGCIAGATKKEEYLGAIRQAGFSGVEVISAETPAASFEQFCGCVTEEIAQETLKAIESIKVTARK